MMTCDKQNENFLIEQQQKQQPNSECENIDTKKFANPITSYKNSNQKLQNSIRSQNYKFNTTKNSKNISVTRMMKMTKPEKSPLQAQTFKPIHSQTRANSACIIKQKLQQQQQQQQQQKQTIISKVSKEEVSTTMAQQSAVQQTHMTLKEYFEFSSEAATTKTVALSSKRINKGMYVQQQQQKLLKLDHKSSSNACATINSGKHQHQLKLWPTFANTTDPADITPNLVTISSLLPSSSSPLSSSSSSSSLLSTEFLPSTKKTRETEQMLPTEFETSPAEPLTIPVSEEDVVEDLQSKVQQCNNVCISSKCGSKQKYCKQQEQQKQKQKQKHCKSANLETGSSNNNIRIFSKINKNTCITKDKTDTQTSLTLNSEVKGLTHTNINTTTSTTNKANIRINTIATSNTATITTTISNNAPNTNASANIAAPARPTELTASASAAATSTSSSTTTSAYSKAFPLRQQGFYYTSNKQMECLLRAIVFSFVFVMSMQYQTVSASTSMMSKHEPMFISRSETFKFVAGETIVLPCEVANTDPYVVAWKRGIAILTAGSVKVTPDPRVRLVNGFNLQIRDAVPQDAGDYICQIATMEPREITHTVEILVPPRIHHISTSGHLQVKKGSSVRIECSASGNPTPNVTWSRKNNILPNGEEKLHSHILSIENVDRHKGGVYICTANNGVGQPASSQVVLHVLYPPEITVERPIVFSGEGHEAMLVCIVHGETQPEVIWFKDTMQLDTTERHIMENRGSRHTLIIRKVHPQDFGNYSCVAENQLGKSRKTLQLSGKPNVAVFNSPQISQYKDRYNISWTVESHTPIEEYKLSFRRLQQGQEVDNSIDTHSSSSSSSMLQMYGGSGIGSMGGSSGSSMMGINAHNYRMGGINSMNTMGGSGGYGSYGAGNVIHWGRNDWRDVVLPAIPISHHYTQGMSYMIRGLDPDQHYEATVQARNRYGWSDYSQSFVFSTSSNDGLTDLSTFLNHGHLSDNEMRDLSVTFYGSKSSRLQSLGSLLLLTAAVSLCVINFNF